MKLFYFHYLVEEKSIEKDDYFPYTGNDRAPYGYVNLSAIVDRRGNPADLLYDPNFFASENEENYYLQIIDKRQQYKFNCITNFNNSIKRAYGMQGRFNPDLTPEQKEEIFMHDEQMRNEFENGSSYVEDTITYADIINERDLNKLEF